jgi:hypothetical protein
MGPGLIALLSSLPSIAGTLTSAIGGAPARKEQKKLYGEFSKEKDKLKAEIDKPYMDTTEAQSVMAQIRRQGKENKRQLTAMQAMNNLSDEAYVGGLGKVAKAEGEAVSNLSGRATQYKSNLRNTLFGAMGTMANMNSQRLASANQSAGNVGAGATDAISGWLMSDVMK